MESSSLVPVLSYILTKMVERNDKILLDDPKRTVFHAQKAPLISLHRYLERVLSFAPCSNSCFIIALIYIDRIIQNNSDFILNSLSVHRMLITSVMVATKFFDDETFNNLYYAKVGGLQVTELNQLEQKFLSLIEFSLTIRAEVFERYRCELVKHAKASSPKVTMQIPPYASKLRVSQEMLPKPAQPSCQRALSRSSTAISTRCAAKTPSPTQALSLVRSVCETVVVESVPNKGLQSQLMSRVTELLNVEEKLQLKVPPSCVKTVCAQLVSEHNLSPSLLARAAVQSERLERLEKMESMWYHSAFDYTARDMVVGANQDGDSLIVTRNGTSGIDFSNLAISATTSQTSNNSTSNSNSSSNNNSNTSNGKGLTFSQCTPSYPSNSHQPMVAVSWG